MSAAGADLLAEIDDLWNKLQDKFTSLRDTINRMLDKVPGFLDWIVDRVRDGWNSLCDKMQMVWDRVSYFFGHMGRPWDLSSTADSWSTDVGGKTSNEVTKVDAGLLLVDDNWAGDAADQYKQHIPLQKAALQAIKTTYTDAISAALDKVQMAIYVFWGLCVTAIVTFIGGMIGALSSAATIFGLPAAPFIAVGAALAADAQFAGGAYNLKAQAASANSSLVAKLADNTAFPNGAWPKGTA
ncbi:hypothetical protein ACXR2U_10220 [Jatrophihabitans sp. YIM 134969]